MKRMLSYWRVRDCDSVRSARQVKASSSRSLRRHRPVQILVVERRLGEAGVVVGHEARQEGVAGLHGADAGEPQLLHQAVLQGLVGALDAALGLAGVGADDLDVERLQRATELGHAVAVKPGRLVDAEDRVLVGVERHRLAVRLEVSLGGVEVGEGRTPICTNCRCISRLVASSMKTSRVHSAPRSSNQQCSEPSIWTSSPTHSRR